MTTPAEYSDNQRIARAIYRIHDGGRRDSRRPRQSNDCVVIAISIVTGLGYDIVYDALAARGRKSGQSTPRKIWEPMLLDMGYSEITFPATKGCARMNVLTFTQKFPCGRFIIKTAKHLQAVENGIVYNPFVGDPFKCVYSAWFYAGVPSPWDLEKARKR